MIIDVAFLIFMIVAVFKGISKGFVVGIFSFIAFLIGLAAALKLSVVVAHYLDPDSSNGSRWLPVLSFALVFIVVVILVNIGARIIRKTITWAMLGWLDKIGGVILYLIIYTIIFSVILFYLEKMSLVSSHTILQSNVYEYVAPWGPRVINGLGKFIPLFKDLFNQLQIFFERIGNKLPS